MCEYPGSPVVRNSARESHFFLVPSRILNYELHELVGDGGDWGAIDRMLRGHLREADSTNCIAESIKRCPPINCWGHWFMGTPYTPYITHRHRHTHSLCGCFPMDTPYGSKSKLWQIASEHAQKTSQNMQAKERPHS